MSEQSQFGQISRKSVKIKKRFFARGCIQKNQFPYALNTFAPLQWRHQGPEHQNVKWHPISTLTVVKKQILLHKIEVDTIICFRIKRISNIKFQNANSIALSRSVKFKFTWIFFTISIWISSGTLSKQSSNNLILINKFYRILMLFQIGLFLLIT